MIVAIFPCIPNTNAKNAISFSIVITYIDEFVLEHHVHICTWILEIQKLIYEHKNHLNVQKYIYSTNTIFLPLNNDKKKEKEKENVLIS